MSGLHKVL